MDPVLGLSYIAIILLAGILCLFLARELKLPYNLLLVLLGLLLGSLVYSGTPVFEVSSNFVAGIAILSLVMLAFDSASRLRLDEQQNDAVPSVRLINLFSLLSLLLVGLFVQLYFFPTGGLTTIFYSFLFAVLVVETDLGSVLVLFKDFAMKRAKHILHFLETEADFNTALVVILPFLILSILRNVNLEAPNLFIGILERVPEFLYEVIVAMAVGIVVGLVMLRVMREWYDHHWTPVVLVTSSLVAYVFTTLIGGNGVVAVAIMGFFFGNSYVAGKEQFSEFSRTLSASLEIMVFVLLGLVVRLPVSFTFVFDSLLLFAFIVLVRVLSVFISLEKDPFTVREKFFIGLNMPKGFALATVILVLVGYSIPGLGLVLQLAVMVMIYSIAASYVLDFYAKPILHEDVKAPVHSLNVLELALEESLVARKKTSVSVKAKPAKKKAAKAKKPAKKEPAKKKKAVAKKKAPAVKKAKKPTKK